LEGDGAKLRGFKTGTVRLREKKKRGNLFGKSTTMTTIENVCLFMKGIEDAGLKFELHDVVLQLRL